MTPKSITQLILENLAELGEVALDVFFPRKYPQARLWRSLLGLDARYHFSRKSFSVILSKLKSQGLVERHGAKRNARWRISGRGLKYLEDFRVQTSRTPPKDGIRRLVIFDVLEKEKAKRQALRRELTAAGYTQLQKSVWVGKSPLPEDFIKFLDALELNDAVHIFSVRGSGTLS